VIEFELEERRHRKDRHSLLASPTAAAVAQLMTIVRLRATPKACVRLDTQCCFPHDQLFAVQAHTTPHLTLNSMMTS
jgi:hypothetical protein